VLLKTVLYIFKHFIVCLWTWAASLIGIPKAKRGSFRLDSRWGLWKDCVRWSMY